MTMATKLNREQIRAASTPAIGKQAAAPRRREARESGQGTSGSRGRGEPKTYRFDLADIRSIAVERHSPLCLVIVVNPPK
jgi:hypothetical protein